MGIEFLWIVVYLQSHGRDVVVVICRSECLMIFLMITWSLRANKRGLKSSNIMIPLPEYQYLFKFSMYYDFGNPCNALHRYFWMFGWNFAFFVWVIFIFELNFELFLRESLQCFTIRDIFECFAGIWYLFCLDDFYWRVKFWILLVDWIYFILFYF